MSSKPKKQDYKPSKADQANAAVAMAEYNKFKQMYDPLLQQMRDKSLTVEADAGARLRGRANADSMQALSGPSVAAVRNVDTAGDMAKAVTGQYGIANRSAKQVANTMQTNVLGTARGQAADAQTGMAQASRLGTAEALSKAKAKQDVAQAKLNAAADIGSALIAQGGENYRQTGNVFKAGTDPVVDPNTGALTYQGSETPLDRLKGIGGNISSMLGSI